MMLKNPKKWESILLFSAICWLLLLINMNADTFFFRLDLTEEKRYTITDATKGLLQNLDDEVYIEVYLEGELNSGFKRLQKAIQEQLEGFKLYSNNQVVFKFINPNDAPTQKARNQFYKQLVAKGLPATTIYEKTDGQNIQKVIFPGAIISYQNKEKAVLLLKGNKGASAAQQLNQSIEGLEYELASTIKTVTADKKKSIAFIQGHQELNSQELSDITTSLSETYIVDKVNLKQNKIATYDAIVVAQPKKKFSEQEKYQLDQFIMNGGSAIFLLDRVQMNLDSIGKGGTYAFGYELNIEDMLFKYGVRVNMDMIQDQQAGLIEIFAGYRGNQANIRKLPWPYFVYLNKFSSHPITRNMDVILGKFISTIDTVKAVGIKKTPLVFTSQYSRIRKAPTMVDLNELKNIRDIKLFNKKHIPVAYLLEGKFISLYNNRFPPKGVNTKNLKKKSKGAKVIVFSDGDIIRSEKDKKTGKQLPIDFDKARGETISNKDFILNALAYLTEENGLITSRNRQVKLRPLDEFKVEEEKLYWQILNIVVPVFLIIAFGVMRSYRRKKKYQS